MLWDETAKALKEYMDRFPSPTEILFKPKRSSIWNLDKLGKGFKKFKESLSADKYKRVANITHKHLRKSCRTAAVRAKCNSEHIKLIMGRSLEGVEDYYTFKEAEMTSEVVAAVHDYYFPHDSPVSKMEI